MIATFINLVFNKNTETTKLQYGRHCDDIDELAGENTAKRGQRTILFPGIAERQEIKGISYFLPWNWTLNRLKHKSDSYLPAYNKGLNEEFRFRKGRGCFKGIKSEVQKIILIYPHLPDIWWPFRITCGFFYHILVQAASG